MDFGEKMTAVENEIYAAAVSVLQKEGIPSTVGRLIMDGVCRRFTESAYYVALQRIELLEKELTAKQSGKNADGGGETAK